MHSASLAEYKNNIEALKNKTKLPEIYTGLEVDYIPNRIAPSDFKGLDYTIGSIHFVDEFANGNPWEIDGLHTLFLQGLHQMFNNRYQDAWHRYFELTRDMIVHSPPTLLGHFDKMKIQNRDNLFFHENEPWYREEVKKVIAEIKKSDVIVEVNTRGGYQRKSPTVYPSPWILELLCQARIPITLSSDAHHPDQLVAHFTETSQLLKEIGFKKLRVMLAGEWKEVNFNEKGIFV